MRNIYKNAVENLRFSDGLHAAVMEKTGSVRSCHRIIRIVAIAAVLACMLAGTALAVSPELRNWTVALLNLGVSHEEMTDAAVMEFRHKRVTDGVTVHYLELDKDN